MAFSANTWWEVQTGGSDTANGGGFDIQNANMLTDLAATVATSAAAVVTSASYTFVSSDIGHWVYVKSGTNWLTGWYQIVSVSAGAATLNTTLGAGVGYFTQTAGKAINSPIPTNSQGCATTASPTAGTWSIDYSQSTSARIAFTDLVIDATTNTKATSAANPFGKQMVGNIIAVTSGTGFTVQRVQIVSVTTAVATMDKSLGTLSSSGGNGGLGGALASPGMAASLFVSNGANGMWIKNGTYTLSVNSANVAGGKITSSFGLAATVENFMFIFGYNAIRADNPLTTSRPTFSCGTLISGFAFSAGSEGMKVGYFIIDGQNRASLQGFIVQSTGVSVYSVKSANCTTTGFNSSSADGTLVNCEYTGGTCTQGFQCSNITFYMGCTSHDFAGMGFNISNCFVTECLAFNCSGASNDGFFLGQLSFLTNCTAYNNGRNGFTCGANSNRFAVILTTCLASTNAGRGFGNNTTADPLEVVLYNCAAFNNTVAALDTGYNNVLNFLTLTADPFVSAGTNFGLNTTAGGGAACRAAGYPSTFPGLASTLSYKDVGAVQAQPSAGSSQVAYAWAE